MLTFVIVVLGQVISLLGSTMTTFALSLWAWELTGKATTISLATLFGFAPTIFLCPLAGALVDRWDRKLVMMLADLAAAIATAVLLILYLAGSLQIWHLYVANAFIGIFGAFQFPAFSAAITNLVPKAQFTRANGLMWLTGPTANILGPILAAALVGVIGTAGIMIVDLVTAAIAITILLGIHIPRPAITAEGMAGRGTLLHEIRFGFDYIFKRPSLLGIQLVFFAKNLFAYPVQVTLLAPMVLARTGNNELFLGTVQSVGAIGGLVGGTLLSLWGGPKRKILGVIFGMIGLRLSQIVLGISHAVLGWAVASFLMAFFVPIINGANQAIWQAKVAPDVQGKVFSARRLIAQFPSTFAMMAIGPLADRVFEPAMMPGGRLAAGLGWLTGTGPGAGISLMMILAGVYGISVAIFAFANPNVRYAEERLLDFDQLPFAQTLIGE